MGSASLFSNSSSVGVGFVGASPPEPAGLLYSHHTRQVLVVNTVIGEVVLSSSASLPSRATMMAVCTTHNGAEAHLIDTETCRPAQIGQQDVYPHEDT